jgi:spore maturation protein CgeB
LRKPIGRWLAMRNKLADRETSIVLVGNPGVEHVGGHLRNAIETLRLPLQLCDSNLAFQAHPLLAKFNWWFRSRTPSHLRQFSRSVERACIETNADFLLATGLAPIDAETLESAGRAGTFRMNFLTDDPWNPQHTARWFMRALPKYDIVFSPRRANMEDLRQAGCGNVQYLPFAYAPEIHFLDPPKTPDEEALYAADVVFAGGADADRVPYVSALTRAGLRVALYGGYWRRFPETRSWHRGFATPDVLRKAIGGAHISLCLVRRANRDGHAMRTYELAAAGACILAEDTEEHREILGAEGVSAVYFRSIPDMVAKARVMLRDDNLRHRLAAEVRVRICSGGNAYRDRLQRMFELAEASKGMVPQLT